MIGIEHIWGACCFAVGVVLATICLIAAVAIDDHAYAAATEESEQTNLHLIVFAQDAETEIEVRIGDMKRKKELVDAGVTYLSYRTEDPEVTILAYGDKITPMVEEGRDGEYYALVLLQVPGESVGEEE